MLIKNLYKYYWKFLSIWAVNDFILIVMCDIIAFFRKSALSALGKVMPSCIGINWFISQQNVFSTTYHKQLNHLVWFDVLLRAEYKKGGGL